METATENAVNLFEDKVIEKETKKPVGVKKDTKKTVYHNGWSRDDTRQDWLQYMYEKSNYNKDLMWTFLAENGNMGLLTKSGIVGANGWSDWGICQINAGYHPEILGKGDKYFVDWFYDPYKQIDYCIKKYNGGTKFYGYNVREKSKSKLVFN